MPAGKSKLMRFAAWTGKVPRAFAGRDHILIGDPGNDDDASLRTGHNDAWFFVHGVRTRVSAPGFRIRARAKTFNFDSIFKQPGLNRACAIARILCGAGYAVFPSCAPFEGAERRETLRAWRKPPDGWRSRPTRLGEARRLRDDGGAPLGAPLRRFLSPGPYFRAPTEGHRPPRSGRLSPAFVGAASSPPKGGPP
jgi:hypothetical protein